MRAAGPKAHILATSMTPCWQVMSSSFNRSISVFAAWRPLPTAVPKYLCRRRKHRPVSAQRNFERRYLVATWIAGVRTSPVPDGSTMYSCGPLFWSTTASSRAVPIGLPSVQNPSELGAVFYECG